ncbi:MAG: DUF1631 domain-containing protein [Gammaproteobacteria bacterium]|nr:DUF1631 domain-containing protein [Gammaproteobacteria bacterium]
MPKSISNTISDDYQRLIKELRSLAGTLLSGCLEDFQQKAKDPDFRSDLGSANPYLRLNALDAFLQAYDNVFRGYIKEAVQGIQIESTHSKKDRSADEPAVLSLVDAEELDVDLALKRAMQHTEDALKEPLLHIEIRLEELGQLLTGRFNHLCLHPQAFYQPFKDAVMNLDIEAEAKVLLCEIFEQVLSTKISTFYERANGRLMELGILAERQALERAIRARDRAGHSTQSPAATDKIIGGVATGEFGAPMDARQMSYEQPSSAPCHIPLQPTPTHQGAVYPKEGELQQVVQQYFDSESIGQQPAANTLPSPVSSQPIRVDIIQALTAVQADSVYHDVALDQTMLKQAIRNSSGSQTTQQSSALADAWQVPTREQKIIDFINDIFSAMFSGEAMTDATKALVAKLQIPILKLALLDTGFLNQANHPARDILKLLMSMGVGIESKEEVLFRKLQSIIDKVIEEFETDITPFDDALGQLRKLNYIEADQAQEIEQQSRQEAQVKAHRLAAKRKVIACLNRYLKEKRVPEQILKFFVKLWAPYMGVIQLESGSDSLDWDEAVRNIRQIIEAAQPERSANEIEQIFDIRENFFKQLKQRLTHLPWFTETESVILSNMEAWFDRHSAASVTADTQTPEQPTSENPLTAAPHEVAQTSSMFDFEADPDEDLADHEERLRAKLEEVPAELKPGVWVEIYRGEDRSKRRLKLSTILHETGELLFSDRMGEGVLEVDLENFLIDLDAGRTKLIDDSNLFDHALTSIISNIRENQQRQLHD